MDLDVGISLVPPQVSAVVPKVTTVDTELNTTSTFVSTASPQRHIDTTGIRATKRSKREFKFQMSLDEELAQKLHEEEQKRFNVEQEAKFDAEVAQKLQEELDAAERQRMAQVHEAA
ncbi:hypothetical protein Tco_0851910 [Tanacetum coccineum]